MDKNSVFSQDTLKGERALRLDGAMGTQIQRFKLTEEDFRKGLPVSPTRDVKGDNECLNLTRPDVISSIHRASGLESRFPLNEEVKTGEHGGEYLTFVSEK